MSTHQQVLHYASQLKSQIKKQKQSFPSMPEWQHFYKHFKKLYEMIKTLVQNKDQLTQTMGSTQPLQFFETLHQTTIDMRMKLLADLGKSEIAKKKLKQQMGNLQKDYRDQLQIKNQKIRELQRLLNQRNGKNKQDNNGLVEKLRNQFDGLAEQCQKLRNANKKLLDKLNLQAEAEKGLKNQLKKARSQNQANRTQTKTQASYAHTQTQTQAQNQNRRMSPSPDRVIDNTDSKIAYDNVLGSFLEYPNQKNYTEWDNTYSHHDIDRKAKSVSGTGINNHARLGDELWRFIYIQALSIQEYIEKDEVQNYKEHY